MNPKAQLVAAMAALLLPHVVAGSGIAPIVIRFGEPPRVSSPSTPPVFFALPKYTLTSAERDTVAACLVLEAANQGEFGMRSVMSVIRNRARGQPELFAPTVLRVKQFSALNKLTAGRESFSRMVARAQRDPTWPIALRIVDDAMEDQWHDPTGGATHYTRTGERTHWTRSLAKTTTIGAHSFYR